MTCKTLGPDLSSKEAIRAKRRQAYIPDPVGPASAAAGWASAALETICRAREDLAAALEASGWDCILAAPLCRRKVSVLAGSRDASSA